MTTNKPEISISNYTPVIYETAVDFGDAVSFDGVNDYVETNNLTGLNTGNQVHTIEQWVYLPELASDENLLHIVPKVITKHVHSVILVNKPIVQCKSVFMAVVVDNFNQLLM
ncbi:MAG: hypothetical protein AAFX46_12655 [Cyanobacteria bacterium J06636_27]